jgi:phosphoglycolate phosphatase
MEIKGNTFKAFIFDLDGTLIDSDKDIHEIINFIRVKKLKKKKIKLQKIAKLTSFGGKNLIKNSISSKNTNYYLKLFRSIYLNSKIRKNLLFPNTIKFLSFLKKKKIKIFICTNKPKLLTSNIIKKTPLKKYINGYFCPDDYQLKKPDKKFFELILKRIKINSKKIIYIGDSLIDYYFAKKANVNFYLFKNKRIKYPNKIYFDLYNSNKIIYNYKNIKMLYKNLLQTNFIKNYEM